MKGWMKDERRRERCGGRPGGDQWGGWDAIWQVQLGDCPPPSAANWSIWRPITAAHVTRASSNPIITRARAYARGRAICADQQRPPSDPVVSPCTLLLNLLNRGQPRPVTGPSGASTATRGPHKRSDESRRLSAHVGSCLNKRCSPAHGNICHRPNLQT